MVMKEKVLSIFRQSERVSFLQLTALLGINTYDHKKEIRQLDTILRELIKDERILFNNGFYYNLKFRQPESE